MSGGNREPKQPPHPATVVQPKRAFGIAPAAPPHPATVAQPKRAFEAATVGRPPHAATVVQPKRAFESPPAARPPHAATAGSIRVVQTAAAPPTTLPPHAATLPREAATVQPKVAGVAQAMLKLTLRGQTYRTASGGGGPPDPNPGSTTTTEDDRPPRHLVLRLRGSPPSFVEPTSRQVTPPTSVDPFLRFKNKKYQWRHIPKVQLLGLLTKLEQSEQSLGQELVIVAAREHLKEQEREQEERFEQLSQIEPRSEPGNRRERRARLHGRLYGHRLGGLDLTDLSDRMLSDLVTHGYYSDQPSAHAAVLREIRRRQQPKQPEAPLLITTGGVIGGRDLKVESKSLKWLRKYLRSYDNGTLKIGEGQDLQIAGIMREVRAEVKRRIPLNEQAGQRLRALLPPCQYAASFFDRDPYLKVHAVLKELELCITTAIEDEMCVEQEGKCLDLVQQLAGWVVKHAATSGVIIEGKKLYTLQRACELIGIALSESGIPNKRQRKQRLVDLQSCINKWFKGFDKQSLVDAIDELRELVSEVQDLFNLVTAPPKSEKSEEITRPDVVLTTSMSPTEGQNLLPLSSSNGLELANAMIRGNEDRHTGFVVRGRPVLHCSRGSSLGGISVFWIVDGNNLIVMAMAAHITGDSYRIRWRAPGLAYVTTIVLGSKDKDKQLRDE